MIKLDESVTIDRSPKDVWAVVEDYAADSRWRRGLVEMTPTPPGRPAVGTTVHEVLRTAGSIFVSDTTVTKAGPAMAYEFSGHGTSGGVSGGRSVVETPDGRAVFTYDILLDLEGPLRFVSPVVTWVMRRSLRRDLRTLRAQMEADA